MKPFVRQINDVYNLQAAVAKWAELNKNSTDSDDVAAVAEAAAGIYAAYNLQKCRELYLQGLANWQKNEDQRSGLNLPPDFQPSLMRYCKQFGVPWSPELAAESDALFAVNERPRIARGIFKRVWAAVKGQ